MPTAEQHRAQAAGNEAFYVEIGGADAVRPDWALTVLFYAAVHETAALLVDGRTTIIGYGLDWPPSTHRERKAALDRHPPWQPIGSQYRNFESWSRKTRYECFKPDRSRLVKMESLLSLMRTEIARVT